MAHDLSENVFTACSVLKHAWRDSHPQIVALWHDVDRAVKDAMARPGQTFTAGRLRFTYGALKFGSALVLHLPSGRKLYYYSPKFKKGRPDDAEEEAQNGETSLTFMGLNSVTRKWQRIWTYSGKMVENATQAVARDIMLQTFPLIEAHGYPIILSVHDEVLTEVPDDPRYNAEELSELLSTGGSWTKGLPLRAEGWEGYFYRK
jgi:DNA polymerase